VEYLSLLNFTTFSTVFNGLSEKMDGAGESHFVSHFSGNIELTSVITEEVSASLATVDCEFGCMSRLIDRSYLSGAVEEV
jgi:hypothetical protein